MCQSIYNIINLPFITSLGWYFDRDDFLLFREHLENERYIVYVKSNSTKKCIEVITIHLQTMFVFYFVLTINLLNIVKVLLFGNVFLINILIIILLSFFRQKFVQHIYRRCIDQTLWNLVGISYDMWSCAFKGLFYQNGDEVLLTVGCTIFLLSIGVDSYVSIHSQIYFHRKC